MSLSTEPHRPRVGHQVDAAAIACVSIPKDDEVVNKWCVVYQFKQGRQVLVSFLSQQSSYQLRADSARNLWTYHE